MVGHRLRCRIARPALVDYCPTAGMSIRLRLLGVLQVVARFNQLGAFCAVARLGFMGVFYFLARFGSLGDLGFLARFNLVGTLPFVARFRAMGVFSVLAISISSPAQQAAQYWSARAFPRHTTVAHPARPASCPQTSSQQGSAS